MVVCGKKDFYPIKYKESYKPDLHFLKIRSLVSLRKLQASKCTESWLVLTTTVETVSFFFKGLLKKPVATADSGHLLLSKPKNTIQGLTIFPGHAH